MFTFIALNVTRIDVSRGENSTWKVDAVVKLNIKLLLYTKYYS